VDALYEEIHQQHPTISKATVYRNLSTLTKQNKALQIPTAGDVARYDGCTDVHHHFICNRCGGVFDVPTEGNENAAKDATPFAAIRNDYGFIVERSMTLFYGVCKECVVNESI